MRAWFLYTLLAITTLLLIYSTYSPYELTHREAKTYIQTKSAIVLDVRTDKEREEGFYEGSIHIPEQKLTQDVERNLPNKTRPIVVYCATGRRAKYATESLRSMGYTHAFFIRGTYTDLQ